MGGMKNDCKDLYASTTYLVHIMLPCLAGAEKIVVVEEMEVEKFAAETKKVKNNIGMATTTTKTATKKDFGIINVDQFSSSVVADDEGKEEESIETNNMKILQAKARIRLLRNRVSPDNFSKYDSSWMPSLSSQWNNNQGMTNNNNNDVIRHHKEEVEKIDEEKELSVVEQEQSSDEDHQLEEKDKKDEKDKKEQNIASSEGNDTKSSEGNNTKSANFVNDPPYKEKDEEQQEPEVTENSSEQGDDAVEKNEDRDNKSIETGTETVENKRNIQIDGNENQDPEDEGKGKSGINKEIIDVEAGVQNTANGKEKKTDVVEKKEIIMDEGKEDEVEKRERKEADKQYLDLHKTGQQGNPVSKKEILGMVLFTITFFVVAIV